MHSFTFCIHSFWRLKFDKHFLFALKSLLRFLSFCCLKCISAETLFTIIQHYSTLFNITQHYSTLFNIIQHYSTLINFIQHYSTLFNIIQHYSKLFNFNQLYSTLACRLAEWVAFLHAVVIATVVMCRVRNPACTARERPRVGALYKW